MKNYLYIAALLTTPLIACAQTTTTAPTTRPTKPIPFNPSPLRADLYHDGWTDFNKNGKQDIYETASAPIEKRIDDLLSQMTLEEKTCQLATLYGYGRVLKDPFPTPEWKNEVWKDGIANIDEMHNGVGKGVFKDTYAWPPSLHAREINEIQRWFIEETRLGIPVDFTNEGLRGLNAYKSTNFPVGVALGATWDRDLIHQIGTITGQEARAEGFTNVYSPTMDLSRDPRWGRVLECYSEDPYLAVELDLQQIKGIQAQGVVSTAKHFAVHSEPKGGRDGSVRTDPHIAPREMEMLYLYGWQRAVREANLLGLMVSYNDYDGIPIAGSHEFMIDRLRTQWGFQGYIVSDSGAVENLDKKHRVAPSFDAANAMYIEEGGNVCTNFSTPDKFIDSLRKSVKNGSLPIAAVDARVRDVLRVKFLMGMFDRPYVTDPASSDAIVHSPANISVSLRAARESVVLLKNKDHTLPLSKNLKRILVCGPTAKLKENFESRYGSQGGDVVTLFDGIQKLVGKTTTVDFAQGANPIDDNWPDSELFPEAPTGKALDMINDAVAKAQNADTIIVCLGDCDKTIGEAKSRTSLDLPGYQLDLVKALMKTNKPVVVILQTGKAASINWIDRYCPAIVESWFNGELGGQATAEVLFGDYNPSGKLPNTWPRTVGQIPFNFPFKPSSQAGQSKAEDPNGSGNSMANGALYNFGFGLSYTTFAYSNLSVTPASLKADGTITISCKIKNTGSLPGDEIAQLYLEDVVSSVITYDSVLRGFERVSLAPGETKTVTFTVPAQSMQLINRQNQKVVEPGNFKVMLGSSSTDIHLKGDYAITP